MVAGAAEGDVVALAPSAESVAVTRAYELFCSRGLRRLYRHFCHLVGGDLGLGNPRSPPEVRN
jgi:hypothetical protein